MVSLYAKREDGHISPLPLAEGSAVFPSLSAFEKTLEDAETQRLINQLILVGSRNDIAWIHASLPQALANHITAEIEYPLVAGWFRQPAQLPRITHALEQVFAA